MITIQIITTKTIQKTTKIKQQKMKKMMHLNPLNQKFCSHMTMKIPVIMIFKALEQTQTERPLPLLEKKISIVRQITTHTLSIKMITSLKAWNWQTMKSKIDDAPIRSEERG